MPSLIHPTTIRFPIILAYYFINAIVWISDFKPLHLEGDVAAHKYYCTLNSTTNLTLFPSQPLKQVAKHREFINDFSLRTYFGGQSTFTCCVSLAKACFPRLTHTSYWPGCQSLESNSSAASLSPRAELTFGAPLAAWQPIKAVSKDRETTTYHTPLNKTRSTSLLKG